MKEGKPEKTIIKKRGLTPEEQQVVDRSQQKQEGRHVSLFRVNEAASEQTLELNMDITLADHDATKLYFADLQESTGISYSDDGFTFLQGVLSAAIPSSSSPKEQADLLNVIARTMHAMQPQDQFEAQLIAQLIVLQTQSMEWLGRAKRTERIDFANVYVNAASKLLTRHHEALDLNRD